MTLRCPPFLPSSWEPPRAGPELSLLFCPLGWDPQGLSLSPGFWPFKLRCPKAGSGSHHPQNGQPLR